MQIETIGTEGIRVTFPDAEIILSINGRFPCSACGERLCEHFHAALPEFQRWRWMMAESKDCPWGPSLLQNIGIAPPYIVRPDLVYKQTRWAPVSQGLEVALGVRMWYTAHGELFHFWDNGHRLTAARRLPDGHVYVGDDHPGGHTDCLICRNGCDHVKRALELSNREAA